MNLIFSNENKDDVEKFIDISSIEGSRDGYEGNIEGDGDDGGSEGMNQPEPTQARKDGNRDHCLEILEILKRVQVRRRN